MLFRSLIFTCIPICATSFLTFNHLDPITTRDCGTNTMSLMMVATPATAVTDTITTKNMPSTPGAKFLKEPQVVEEMPNPLPDDLKNTYYLLRHGQSTANVASVISSSRSLAYSDRHGVTSLGYEQGKQSASQLVQLLQQESSKGDKVVFISSPFARARQTAQACIDGLFDTTFVSDGEEPRNLSNALDDLHLDISSDIILDERLMERYFGRLDDEAIYTYAYVWPLDGFDVTHTAFDVESVAAVCTRLNDLINDLEDTFNKNDDSENDSGKYHVVLVSHADVLQIAQLYGANAPNVGKFSSYRFTNGEVRVMKRTPDSLPEPSPLEAPQRGTRTSTLAVVEMDVDMPMK